ncbi:MAG: SRPBCC family protein [Bacteroidota bacterium]
MTTITNAQITLAEGTNKAFEYTLQTTASPEQIWTIWTDVENWHLWDSGLQTATLEGQFKLNAKGKLIPDKGPKSNFKITHYTDGETYTMKTPLPLGSLNIERILETKEGKTYFTHRVYFKGLTAGIFAGSFGKRYRELLPQAMLEIKKIAELENEDSSEL